jgi:hypothetical protein
MYYIVAGTADAQVGAKDGRAQYDCLYPRPADNAWDKTRFAGTQPKVTVASAYHAVRSPWLDLTVKGDDELLGSCDGPPRRCQVACLVGRH